MSFPTSASLELRTSNGVKFRREPSSALPVGHPNRWRLLRPADSPGVPPDRGPPDGAGGTARYGRSGPVIWNNEYFFIKGHELDLKMFIKEAFATVAALGNRKRSRTITPHRVGETRFANAHVAVFESMDV